MGAVEIRIDEDGALKVVQRYDLRPVLKRLQPEGFERHRVSTWPTCSVKRPDSCCCWSADVEEAKFNRALKLVFIFVLCLGVGNLVLIEPRLINGILILAMFAAVLAAGVFAKNVVEKARSAPPKREEVQTVSALIQQV